MTLRRAGLALVSLTLIALSTTVPPGHGAGALTAGSPGSRTGAIPLPNPTEPIRITVVDQTTFVGPGSEFALGLRLEGTDGDETLSLTLHQPVANRIAFGTTLAGEGLGGIVQQIGPVRVGDLPTEQVALTGRTGVTETVDIVRLRLSVPDPSQPDANPFVLNVTTPGVSPLVITLNGDSRRPATPDSVVTHVVHPARTPPDNQGGPIPLAVATLVRLDAAVATDATGSPQLTPVNAARLAEVVAVLAGTDRPADVLTTGEVLAALADAEPTAPLGDALAGRLLRPTWSPISVTDLLAANEPGFVDRQLITGTGTARALSGDSGTGSVGVLDSGIDPEALTLLVRLGVTGVIVPESLAEPLNTQRFPVTLTQSFTVVDSDGVEIPALQTDLALSSLLVSSTQPALAANRVLADLAMLAFDFPDLARAAVLDAGGDFDPRALALVLDGLSPQVSGPPGTTPLLGGRRLAEAIAFAAPVRDGLQRRWDAAEPGDLGNWPLRLAATDAATSSLVATIDPTPGDNEAATTVAAVNRLVLASGAAGLTDRARARFLDDADAVISRTLANIGIPAQGTVTLTSDTGVVPITLQNGLPDPVQVRLRVVSDKLEFPDGDTLELTLDPGANRREVAVRTRATGSFPVELDLRTPDDARLLATGRLSVRSTAFSGLGLGLTLLAGVFLAAWWARHFRSTRRSRQLVGGAATDPPTSGGRRD